MLLWRIADGTKQRLHINIQIQALSFEDIMDHITGLQSVMLVSLMYDKVFCYQSVNKRVFKNNMEIVFLVARNKCVYYCRFTFLLSLDSFSLSWKLSHEYMYRLLVSCFPLEDLTCTINTQMMNEKTTKVIGEKPIRIEGKKSFDLR